MKILKNFLFRRRYTSALKKRNYEQRFVTYDNAKTVFLLFEFDAEKYTSFISIIKSLERDGKKVIAWAYCSVKAEKTLEREKFPKLNIFGKKSLNYSGKPQTETLNELQKHSFDLLIDLSLQPLIPLMYTVLYAQAGCKTGIKKTDYSLFNFMIDINTSTNNDEQSVFNQIIFYLKSIQTTD